LAAKATILTGDYFRAGFKGAYILVSIFELINAVAITHLIVVPLSSILVAICKDHFALPRALTIHEFPLINVTRLILKETHRVNLIRGTQERLADLRIVARIVIFLISFRRAVLARILLLVLSPQDLKAELRLVVDFSPGLGRSINKIVHKINHLLVHKRVARAHAARMDVVVVVLRDWHVQLFWLLVIPQLRQHFRGLILVGP